MRNKLYSLKTANKLRIQILGNDRFLHIEGLSFVNFLGNEIPL